MTEPVAAESYKASSAPGVDGKIILKMGSRTQYISVSGLIQAATHTSIAAVLASCVSTVGDSGTLTGHFADQAYSNCTLLVFQPAGPRTHRGPQYQLPFRAIFLQAGT